MAEISRDALARAHTALIPFVAAYGLPLNPEDLDELAFAVVSHLNTDESLQDIYDSVQRQIVEAIPANAAKLSPAKRSEMFRNLPFPFEDHRFPYALGAVIQRTVLDGKQPAREVIHTLENDWLVGDGINEPNLPGAAVAACMLHVIEQHSSVATLATVPLGHVARRDDPGRPWTIEQHTWPPEEEAS